MGFALKLAKVPQPEIDGKVAEAARILDLEQHLDRKPANLSGGQRQRVAMGRAIVRNPSVFLMDEPLSNLDAKLRVQMRTEIARIQQHLQTTTIYVTHDQTEAMTLGHRIAVMRAGTLQQVGAPAELYSHPINPFVAGFIGSPSMNFLPGELNGDSVKLPIGEVRIPGQMRHRLERGPGGGADGVIAGLRPEHFEDASLVSDPFPRDDVQGPDRGARIRWARSTTRTSRLPLNGSPRASWRNSPKTPGRADLPRSREGSQVIARLSADSNVTHGAEIELWFDSDHLQLFDAHEGHSLLAGNEDGNGAQPAHQEPALSAGQSRGFETTT
jgi:multiple sugar transport system ATP-binding protein